MKNTENGVGADILADALDGGQDISTYIINEQR